MNHTLRQFFIAVALAFVGATSTSFTWAQASMTIVLSGRHILTGDSAVIEVMDRTCNNRILGRWTLAGNQTIRIMVCRDGAGYGNIATRNVTNNGHWYGASLLHEGDNVYP
jgi:hypothetical protein